MLAESLQRIDCATTTTGGNELLQVPPVTGANSEGASGGDPSTASDDSAPRSPLPTEGEDFALEGEGKVAGSLGNCGHSFYRKSLSKPAYCHHCGEVIWSPLSTGFACDGTFSLSFRSTFVLNCRNPFLMAKDKMYHP